MSDSPSEQDRYERPNQFTSTHWSVVLAAGDTQSPDVLAARERLCRTYWFPLYAFLRRTGSSDEDAKDLTQGFFAHLLHQKHIGLGNVHPDQGRFRSFLLTAVKNYQRDEWEKSTAQKRGGGAQAIPFGDQDADERYRSEPADPMTPERIYDYQWAKAVVGKAEALLEQEFASNEKAEWFTALKSHLFKENRAETYHKTAARLGQTEPAVRCAVGRLRDRLADLIREEVAHTLNRPTRQTVDAEMRELLSILGSNRRG